MDTTLNLSASEDLSKLDFDGSCRNREFKTASLQDLINEFSNNGNTGCSQQTDQIQEAQLDKDQQFHKEQGHSQNFIIKIRKGLPFKQQVNLLKYLSKNKNKKEEKQVPTEEATSPDRISTAHTLRSDGWSKLQEEEMCHNKDKNAEQIKKNVRMSVQEPQTQNGLLDKGNQLVQGRRIHKSVAFIQTTCPEIQKLSLPHLTQNECSSPFLKSDTEDHQITTTTIAHLHESKEDESQEGLGELHSDLPCGKVPIIRKENIQRRKFTHDGTFNMSPRVLIENIISKKRYSEKIEINQPESPLLKDTRSNSHTNLYQHHPFDPKPEGYRKSLFGSRTVRKSMV